MLLGADVFKEITDPDAFPVLLDPPNGIGSTVSGSITFKDDSDDDGIVDDKITVLRSKILIKPIQMKMILEMPVIMITTMIAWLMIGNSRSLKQILMMRL